MKIKDMIRAKLEDLARKKLTITYRGLGEEFGIPYEHGNMLASILGEISIDTYEEYELMLSALVLRWDGIIGTGFIHLAWEYEVDGVNDPDFVKKHQEKIFKHFSKIKKQKEDENILSKNTLVCPCHKKPLEFHVFQGMRVVKDGFIKAKCSVKGNYFKIRSGREKTKKV